MTDRFDDVRQSTERVRGDDVRLNRLESELGRHFDERRGGFTQAFQKDLDNLKADILTQQDAKETKAPSYVSKSGGILPASYKPHHDILLSDEMKGLDSRQIENSTGFRAMRAGLEQQGLTCEVTTQKVWDDGAYGPRADEGAFARCVTVRHMEGAELRDPLPHGLEHVASREPTAQDLARKADNDAKLRQLRDELRQRHQQPQGVVGRVKGFFGRFQKS
ncbi:MAG: hypothetical protein GC134_08385 [Proteobacteria bacterium]|nr:hypothetical protein [Pseudomonadota bacterium]